MLCHLKTLEEYICLFSKFGFGSLEIIIDEISNSICWVNSSVKNRPLSNGISIEEFGNSLCNTENNIICLGKIFQALKNKNLENGVFITKLEFQEKIIYTKIYANLMYSSQDKRLLGCYCVINFIPNYSPIMRSFLEFRSVGSSVVVLDGQKEYEKFSTLLNQREHEILTLLAMHKSHKDISGILSTIYKKDILPNVITTTISRGLYSKLGVNNSSDLVFKAIELGVLDFIPASLLQQGQ